jgi:lipoprotein-anchoring transpeptidase ErfK/SrfK
MDPLVKWIGGASLAVALFFAAAFAAGHVLGTEDAANRPAASDRSGVAALVNRDAGPPARASSPADQPEGAAAAPAAADAAAPKPAAAPQPRLAAKVTAAPSPRSRQPQDEPFVIKRVLPIKGPIKYGDWYWDDKGVPNGPLLITVDLQARVLSVFKDGYEIGATAVLLGTRQHPTPTGRFPILTKERHNVSEKYGDAPMPWTLRLTWDGVAIHGGHAVELGFASHGCISTPDPFQAKLFAIAKKGDLVIITDGKRTSLGQSLIDG